MKIAQLSPQVLQALYMIYRKKKLVYDIIQAKNISDTVSFGVEYTALFNGEVMLQASIYMPSNMYSLEKIMDEEVQDVQSNNWQVRFSPSFGSLIPKNLKLRD